MRIGINGRFLLQPFTGIGQVTKNLFRELSAMDPKNEYVFIVPEDLPAKLKREFGKNVKFKVLHERNLLKPGMKKTWWEQVSLIEYFENEGKDGEKFDWVIYPYPSNPWPKDFYKKGPKVAVMVHDCIPWKNKEYTKGVLSKIYHFQSKRAVKNADLVLTVSETSKKDIVKYCGVKRNEVKVIYNDVSPSYKNATKGADKILKKYGLKKGEFFLYCGGYDERKNVEQLIEEYETFKENSKSDMPLVLAGGKLFESSLYSSFDDEIEGLVKTGFLSESELANLYSTCCGFIHISKEEGFNIPLLEAANCEAPLILSQIPVHKEIAGNAAIFVKNKDGEAAKAMRKVCGKRVRDGLVKKSRELAKKYSWKESAKKLKNMLSS